MSSDVYVVFESSKGNWWNRFIDKEIAHCFLLIPCNGDWVVLNKDIDKTEVFTIETLSDIITTAAIIKTKAIPNKRGLFMLNTCVGQVKQYLGIRKPFIWTPKQLMRYLNEQT
jgi:hypothetical protein